MRVGPGFCPWRIPQHTAVAVDFDVHSQSAHVRSYEAGKVSFLTRRAGNADKFLAKLDDGAGWVSVISVIHEWECVGLFG